MSAGGLCWLLCSCYVIGCYLVVSIGVALCCVVRWLLVIWLVGGWFDLFNSVVFRFMLCVVGLFAVGLFGYLVCFGFAVNCLLGLICAVLLVGCTDYCWFCLLYCWVLLVGLRFEFGWFMWFAVAALRLFGRISYWY